MMSSWLPRPGRRGFERHGIPGDGDDDGDGDGAD